MTDIELKRIEETKRRNFNRKFGKCYGIKLMVLQGHCNPQGEGFIDIDLLIFLVDLPWLSLWSFFTDGS